MDIQIKPSAAIRNDYNGISSLCKESKQPVFLTKNGEGDLVVMDIESYNRREKMLRLRESLVSAEETRINGEQGYAPDEVEQIMRDTVRGIKDAKQ